MLQRSGYMRIAIPRDGSMRGWQARARLSPLAVSHPPFGCSYRREPSSAHRCCICTAVLFSVWTLFFVVQTTLVASGRLQRHRAWGLLGVSLATAMVLVGVAVADEALMRRLAAGYGDRARAFHIATMSMMVLFAGFFCAAIVYVRKPEIHKRLMLLATISVLPPAIARVFYLINVGMSAGLRPGLAPPRTVESVLAPALIADTLILAGMIYDLRTRGRIHPTYVIGGVIMVGMHLLRAPVSTTQWWYGVADFLARFSG